MKMGLSVRMRSIVRKEATTQGIFRLLSKVRFGALVCDDLYHSCGLFLTNKKQPTAIKKVNPANRKCVLRHPTAITSQASGIVARIAPRLPIAATIR
jgi:hypothetical protein